MLKSWSGDKIGLWTRFRGLWRASLGLIRRTLRLLEHHTFPGVDALLTASADSCSSLFVFLGLQLLRCSLGIVLHFNCCIALFAWCRAYGVC